MISLQASEAEVEALVAGRVAQGADAGIAAINGPTSTVVSGERQAVDEIAAHFAGLGRKTRRLQVSHAFHSHRMDGMLAAFGAVARGLSYHPPRIPIVSNVTGRIADDELASLITGCATRARRSASPTGCAPSSRSEQRASSSSGPKACSRRWVRRACRTAHGRAARGSPPCAATGQRSRRW